MSTPCLYEILLLFLQLVNHVYTTYGYFHCNKLVTFILNIVIARHSYVYILLAKLDSN